MRIKTQTQFLNYLKSNYSNESPQKGSQFHGRKNEFAILSKLAYYKNPDKIAKKYGFEVLKKTVHYTVLQKDGEVIISFKGTTPSFKKDLEADYKILINKPETNELFQESLELIKELKEVYSNIKCVGHSLGGALSIYVNQNNPDVDAIVFNPGSSPFVNYDVNDNVIIYRYYKDIISQGYNTKNNQDNIINYEDDKNILETLSDYLNYGAIGTLIKDGGAAHSIDNFINKENQQDFNDEEYY